MSYYAFKGTRTVIRSDNQERVIVEGNYVVEKTGVDGGWVLLKSATKGFPFRMKLADFNTYLRPAPNDLLLTDIPAYRAQNTFYKVGKRVVFHQPFLTAQRGSLGKVVRMNGRDATVLLNSGQTVYVPFSRNSVMGLAPTKVKVGDFVKTIDNATGVVESVNDGVAVVAYSPEFLISFGEYGEYGEDDLDPIIETRSSVRQPNRVIRDWNGRFLSDFSQSELDQILSSGQALYSKKSLMGGNPFYVVGGSQFGTYSTYWADGSPWLLDYDYNSLVKIYAATEVEVVPQVTFEDRKQFNVGDRVVTTDLVAGDYYLDWVEEGETGVIIGQDGDRYAVQFDGYPDISSIAVPPMNLSLVRSRRTIRMSPTIVSLSDDSQIEIYELEGEHHWKFVDDPVGYTLNSMSYEAAISEAIQDAEEMLTDRGGRSIVRATDWYSQTQAGDILIVSDLSDAPYEKILVVSDPEYLKLGWKLGLRVSAPDGSFPYEDEADRDEWNEMVDKYINEGKLLSWVHPDGTSVL